MDKVALKILDFFVSSYDSQIIGMKQYTN